jgi:hypothetical protein
MQGVATDPSLRQAQMNALAKLQDVGSAGGRDAQFNADANRLQTDVNTNTQGQEGAIMQNLATRGMSGGGNELVARNMAVQNGANRQAQMGMDLNAQAQQRALQAIMQGGQLGGQMQAQDFSQQTQKAQAAAAINKFNAQNQQQVITNNTSAKNNAQQWNAQNTQTTADKNTEVKNQGQQYNLGLAQKNYDNQLAKYGIVNNASQAESNAQSNQAQRQDQFLGTAISSGATAYAANQKNEEAAKKKPPGSV